MKKIAILALLFAINISCFAQFDISFSESEKNRNITQEDVDVLKKTTTIFVYQESDEYDLDQLKETLSSVWKITKLEFVNYTEIGDYQNNEKYSFLINSLVYLELKGYISNYKKYISSYNFNLNLVHFRKHKDYYIPYSYARISQHLSIPSFVKFLSYKDIDARMVYLNSEAKYYDSYLGMLKNTLQYLNNMLENIEEVKKVNIDEKRCKYKYLEKLVTETLYVPEFVSEWLTNINRSEVISSNFAEIFENYKYKYKVVKNEELSNLTLNSEEPIYYLITRRAFGKLFINIINSKTGEIVYSEDYEARGIKSKHIKKLNTCISKSISKANREESIL